METLAWAVLLFGAGLGVGKALWGDKRRTRQRVATILVDVAMAIMATSSLIPVSPSTAHWAVTPTALVLVITAGLVYIWPQRKSARPNAQATFLP